MIIHPENKKRKNTDDERRLDKKEMSSLNRYVVSYLLNISQRVLSNYSDHMSGQICIKLLLAGAANNFHVQQLMLFMAISK